MPHAPAHHKATVRRRMATHAPRTQDNRPSASRRGYDARWRRLREFHLARHPLCQDCMRAGRVTPATEVHHLVAIRDGGKRLDSANLEGLCHACHNRRTASEKRGGS